MSGAKWDARKADSLPPTLQRALVLMKAGALEFREQGQRSGYARRWFSQADANAPPIADPVIDGLVKRGLARAERGTARLTDEGKRAAAAVERMCRRCGCVEARACEGGCCWVDDDLCSACVVSTDDLEERAA